MGNEIRHKNIFYIRDLNWIGGVETYINEMLKKYSDLDIGVVYKTAHPEQLKRLRKYCKTYLHEGQKLICDVCIINWDTSIIPFICDEATVYQGIHADYDNEYYVKRGFKPPTHPRIDYYIAITKHIADTFASVSGVPQEKIIQIYNPLNVERVDKPLIFVSATRLSPEKGEGRMKELAKALDTSLGRYLWLIFTDSDCTIDSPNVVRMEPTLDIGPYIELADYVVQVSDSEGDSYTIKDALYRGKPLIVTPLHYLDEMGIKDGKNCYVLEMDCSNVNEIANKVKNIPKFTFKPLEDTYDKILVKSKSHYKPEDINVRLRCKYFLGFDDVVGKRHINNGEEITVDEYRAQELLKFKDVFEVI